ncbi:acyltransferase [Photobacterium leiognathi]|uniref:acyltransferase n=1 Tax=Photobacterium leiognathi TaxID=553611 RepID=UPI002980D0B8|nr:acyltransferase [Photobacterium leiognathi]
MKIKKLIISYIQKNQFINKCVYKLGFSKKFTIRLFIFNLLISFLSGRNQKAYRYCHYTSQVICSKNLVLKGDKSGTFTSLVVSGGCYIQAGNGIVIGEGTIWAANVSMISANHDMNKEDKSWKEDIGIEIGKNCWIGVGATILPKVKIADNCIVAAGAVVTKSCLVPHSILAGVPAKIIN